MGIEQSGRRVANAMACGTDVFFPDGLDDARVFAVEHGAWPIDETAFLGWLLGIPGRSKTRAGMCRLCGVAVVMALAVPGCWMDSTGSYMCPNGLGIPSLQPHHVDLWAGG